jgi:hypothetical protein
MPGSARSRGPGLAPRRGFALLVGVASVCADCGEPASPDRAGAERRRETCASGNRRCPGDARVETCFRSRGHKAHDAVAGCVRFEQSGDERRGGCSVNDPSEQASLNRSHDFDPFHVRHAERVRLGLRSALARWVTDANVHQPGAIPPGRPGWSSQRAVTSSRSHGAGEVRVDA